MTKRSEDRKSRLALIRQRLSQANLAGGSAFWKPKPGDNPIRILPGVGNMDAFHCWVQVGEHYLSRTNVHLCPQYTLAMKCPICEVAAELYADGLDESKKIASRIRYTKRFYMNIIDRNNEAAGPQVYAAAKTVFDYVAVLVTDPQYNNFEDEDGILVFDPDAGRDVTVKRVGTGMNDTNYSAMVAARDTPLHADPDVIDQWLDQALDLTPVELSEDPAEDVKFTHDDHGMRIHPIAIEPYDRLKKVIEGVSFEDAGEAEEQEDEDDLPPFPEEKDEVQEAIESKKTRGRSAARTRRTRR